MIFLPPRKKPSAGDVPQKREAFRMAAGASLYLLHFGAPFVRIH